MSVKILAVGDVCGEPGLEFLEKRLKDFKAEHGIEIGRASCRERVWMKFLDAHGASPLS